MGKGLWSVLLTLMVLGALGLGQVAQASTFEDVPEDHWAYEALNYLQDAGLVEGYPDGTFRGDRSFTRYEMAMVIARVFTKMQDWQAMVQGGDAPASAAEVDLQEVYSRLDRLAEEFRDELSALGIRLTAVEDEQAQIRGEMDDLKALIKDSGLSGVARWRAGGFAQTGSTDLTNEVGFETYIQMTYLFQPEPCMDFKLSLTASEIEGPAGTGFIPGANNETGSTAPTTPPFGEGGSSSSFVIDEANLKYYWDNAPAALGQCPTLIAGRQYFSEGEFGLAGDNGYRSNFGLRFNTDYGEHIGAHVGYYRTESINTKAPFAQNDPPSFQSSGLTYEGDDFLMAGLEYHTGEGRVPGHDYQLALRADGVVNGYGAEQYFGLSGNAEIPWFNDAFLNGIRGEWVYLVNNVSNQDPQDLVHNQSSMIIELDIYNNGNTRFSFAGAQIMPLEALPVYANVDNDPFSEWDFTVNGTADAFNLSREGRNYFPADFLGFGIQAEHTFGNSIYSTLTFYNGTRVNSVSTTGTGGTASQRPGRPGMLKLSLKYPFSNNSTMGLDIITAGAREGLDDPITLVRGEFKVHF